MKPIRFKNYLIVQIFKKTNKVCPFYSYSIVEPFYSIYPLSGLHNRHFLGLVGLYICTLFNNEDPFWNKLHFQNYSYKELFFVPLSDRSLKTDLIENHQILIITIIFLLLKMLIDSCLLPINETYQSLRTYSL